MEVYFHQNDNLLELTGLKDEATGLFVTDATITAVMKTSADVEVAGQVWPLSMSYIDGTDGTYRGILDSELEVAVNDRVNVEVTILASGGRKGFAKIPTIVRQRGKTY